MANRFVINAFKAVAYSIIFVVVWNVVFYMLNVYSLNRKMENITSSMTLEVSRHNCLTEDSYNMYKNMLLQIQSDMNSGGVFVRGFNLNYGHNSNYSPVSGSGGNTVTVGGLTYGRDLSNPRGYGDVQIIELEVGVNAVEFFFDSSSERAVDDIAFDLQGSGLTFRYTSLAPCLRYVNVTA